MSSIPSDVATRLQNTADAALRPVAPTQDIADRLSGLVAGDRIMAQIQALLPNGTYRALVNQRNLTLALPFSAKAGDSLTLRQTSSQAGSTATTLKYDFAAGSYKGQAATVATLTPASRATSATVGRLTMQQLPRALVSDRT